MKQHQKYLLCLLFLYVTVCPRICYATLPHCTVTEGEINIIFEQCFKNRETAARKRHHSVLLSRTQRAHNISIPCPVCDGESRTDFEWRVIRRDAAQVFIKLDKPMFDSLVDISLKSLAPLKGTKHCVDKQSHSLRLNDFAMPAAAGTYVCYNKVDKTHPSNFIWNHVDTVGVAKTTAMPLSLSGNQPFEVETLEQLKSIQYEATRQLRVAEETVVRSIFMVTTKLSHVDVSIKQCGPAKMKQTRRCYIGVPWKFDNISDYGYRIETAYKVLKDAFAFLRGASLLTKQMAASLGFEAHHDDKYLLIPLEYGFIKKFPEISTGMAHFPLPGFHIELAYYVKCPAIKSQHLVELAKIRLPLFDPVKPGKVLLDSVYIKVQKLVTIGQISMTLTCGNSNSLNCTQAPGDVIWRSHVSRMTFVRSTSPKHSNLHVTDECHLRFDSIDYHDVDTYYCYFREPLEAGEEVVWSQTPRQAYSLIAQGGNFTWTHQQDGKIGVIVLVFWASILTIGWLIIVFYNRSILAKFKSRAPGSERTEQLRNTYSPFSGDHSPFRSPSVMKPI